MVRSHALYPLSYKPLLFNLTNITQSQFIMQEKKELTHLNSQGLANMVDVSAKAVTLREAKARGYIKMGQDTFAAIQAGNLPKGDVLSTARLAGIMAAKQTSQLIPLCHPLPLHKVEVNITPVANLPGYQIEATVVTKAETGVEMEALASVSICALTLYDMAKALEHGMEIQSIHLVSKTGGKSDYHRLQNT